MPITKDKPPTDAQARRLARMWGGNERAAIGGTMDPTHKVLLERGWLTRNGDRGQFPNGQEWIGYAVSPEGVWALATYFINKAHGR